MCLKNGIKYDIYFDFFYKNIYFRSHKYPVPEPPPAPASVTSLGVAQIERFTFKNH